jgi:molybdopterin-guanine dinucleotide biosynthesis protein A
MTLEEKHKKHGDITKPALGNYGRNEVAIYGTTCDEVKTFVTQVCQSFPENSFAYVDAEHAAEEQVKPKPQTAWQWKNNYVQYATSVDDNAFERKQLLAENDCILVNGNHFEAQEQIIICNAEKENSLRKRIDQLNNVKALILPDGVRELPNYIKEIIKEYSTIPTIKQGDTAAIKQFVTQNYLKAAPLKALVMAGGKSTRMGKDKSELDYHGVPQYQYLCAMLAELNIDTYVSCREEQREFFESKGTQVIADRILNCGPIGGILSAYMQHPDSAWLVLACDVPMLDKALLQELINERDHAHNATAFISPHDNLPEPLIAIWEPKNYNKALQFLAQGYTCPRKVLMNTKTKLRQPSEPHKLANANTPEEMNLLLAQLK